VSAPDHYIRQGDEGLVIRDWLLGPPTEAYPAGEPVDLDGATVTLKVAPIGGGPAIIDAEADIEQTIDPDTRGQVSYTLVYGDTELAGNYLAEYEVVFPGGGGAVGSYPNGGYIHWLITPQIPQAEGYISPEDLKKSLGITNTTEWDRDIARSIPAASRSVDRLCRRRFSLDAAPTTRLYFASEDGYVYIDDLFEQDDPIGVQADGSAWTVDEDFSFGPANAPALGLPWEFLSAVGASGSLVSPADAIWRASTRASWRSASIAITARFGWPTLPPEVAQATGIIANQLMIRLREAPWGIVPVGTEGAIAMRISRYDPQVADLLGDLSRRAPLRSLALS